MQTIRRTESKHNTKDSLWEEYKVLFVKGRVQKSKNRIEKNYKKQLENNQQNGNKIIPINNYFKEMN